MTVRRRALRAWSARARRRGGSRPEALEDLFAYRAVAFGALGVVADHEPVTVGAVVDPDLLDAQVARDGVVAALAGECRACFLAVGAELLSDDVVPAATLQVAAVALGAEAAVEHPDHAGEVPAAQVVADLADDHLVRRVAGERPHPDRDPLTGDRHPEHHLRQVRPVILAVLPVAPPTRLLERRLLVGLILLGLCRLGPATRRAAGRSPSRSRRCQRTTGRPRGQAGSRR